MKSGVVKDYILRNLKKKNIQQLIYSDRHSVHPVQCDKKWNDKLCFWVNY